MTPPVPRHAGAGVMTIDRVVRRVPWYPTSREKRARCGAPDLVLLLQKAGQPSRARLLARSRDRPLMGLRPVVFDPCTPHGTPGQAWRTLRGTRPVWEVGSL